MFTSAHDVLVDLVASAAGEVRLAAPFVSLPVATTLATRASSSPVAWSLLTNLDPVAIANGYLSPVGLRRLIDARVAVRSHPSLHAKVFLAGDGGLVGSGNLTQAGLGTSGQPNLEMSVALTPDQARAARDAFDGWWDSATVVNEAALRDAEARAREVPAVVVPPSRPSPPGGDDLPQVAAELLAEARHVNLWAKAVYGDEEADWEGDDLWIASSKRGKPTFAPGDLVLIYAKDLQVCDAIVEITAEAIWAPDIIAEDRPQEDADRWPWLNWVRGRLWVPSANGIKPADLGFTPQGLQGGHRRLDLAEFAAAVRHFAGDSVQ